MDVRTKKSRCLEAYLDTGRACWEHVVKVVAKYPIEHKRLAKEIADTHGIVYSHIVKEELQCNNIGAAASLSLYAYIVMAIFLSYPFFFCSCIFMCS